MKNRILGFYITTENLCVNKIAGGKTKLDVYKTKQLFKIENKLWDT